MYLRLRNELTTEKFTWTITNFNRILPLAGIPFKSFIIHRGHARKVWRFILYPSSKIDYDYVAVYFAKAYEMFDPIVYNCSISIGGLEGKPMTSTEIKSIDFDVTAIGDVFPRHFLEKVRSLTVQCEITEISAKSFPSVDDFKNLSSDLAALYKDSIHSDLTVHVQQVQFSLHTCVLYARCRRLSHLFGYQSFKQMPEIVQIDNISPGLFNQLMVYIYSGKLEDSNFTLDLFILADKLKLQSLKQCVYEDVQEYRTHTEIATQTVTITWNLKEIKFREEGTVPFVQMFKTACCMTNLAVRMGISKDCDGEKYIDVSMFFLNTLRKPVSLLCVMTWFSNGRVRGNKTDSYNIKPEEEWHFPPFVKLSDIPEIDEDNGPDICLIAEISLSDGCAAYNILDTKTRLTSQMETFTYFERLGSDMKRLLSSNIKSRFKKHDIYLKTVDNYYIPAHKAILWARWPTFRQFPLKTYDESSTCLLLTHRREEIKMMLEYLYTGCVSSEYYNFPCPMDKRPIVTNKCKDLLYGRSR